MSARSKTKTSKTVTLSLENLQAAYNQAGSDAQEVLKNLFPEVDLNIVSSGLKKLDKGFAQSAFESAGLPPDFIEVRATGQFYKKGFYLHTDHKWEIKTDNYGERVLIPTKK